MCHVSHVLMSCLDSYFDSCVPLPLPVFTSCVVLVSMVFDYSSRLFLKVIAFCGSCGCCCANKYSTLLSLLEPNVTIWLAFDCKTFAVHLKVDIRYTAQYMSQQVPASLALKNNLTKVM